MAYTQIASDHKHGFTAIHEQNMCFCLALHFNQPELRLCIIYRNWFLTRMLHISFLTLLFMYMFFYPI